MVSIAPYWTNRVNDPLGGQFIASRNSGFACWAPGQCPALHQQLWPGSAMNRPIHSTTAQQRCVCRVHDRIDGLLRDIAFHNRNSSQNTMIYHHSNQFQPDPVQSRPNLEFITPSGEATQTATELG